METSKQEMIETKTFYITRSVPLHDFCFFVEKPTMLILRNGNILWTDAEFACKIYGVHLVMPMLDVPVGKCWEVEVKHAAVDSLETKAVDLTVIAVIDRDVDVVKHVR